MLHDSSNNNNNSYNNSNDVSQALGHYSSFHGLDSTHHRTRYQSINRILLAAIEEQKHRRDNGFSTYNHNSLLDKCYDDNGDYYYDDDEEYDHDHNVRKFDEYIEKLHNQRTRRLTEAHERYYEMMSEREHQQRKVEEAKQKKELALSIVQRRMMKEQPTLKLVDLSNVNVEYKSTLPYGGSIRTSSSITLSPQSTDTTSYSFEDEEEDEENLFDIDLYQHNESLDLEIESSSNFDEDEDYNQWDDVEIKQSNAFDESDYIVLSLDEEDEEEGFQSPMNKENNVHEQLRGRQPVDGQMFQSKRFMTITNHSY